MTAALLFSIALAAFASPTNRVPLVPAPRHADAAARFARLFPREHLSRRPLDDAVSRRAWTNYLSQLDYDHVYFLASDTRRFAAWQDRLDDELLVGDLRFPYAVFETFLERVRDRCEYLDDLLETGFDLERPEQYRWKRKQAPWPRNAAERDDLWRRRIKNEYIQRTLARELGSETNATATATNQQAAADYPAPSVEDALRQRYEQLLTVLQDNDAEWVLQRYLTAVAQAYDPHSSYMSASTLEDFNIEMKLSLVGIGALLRSEDGAAKIVRLIPGGPADRDTREKRLRPGDKIIAVGQGDAEPVNTLHWPLNKVVRLIRGEKGTRVVLIVVPASDPTDTTTKRVELVRDEVRLEEQAARSDVHTVTAADGSACRIGVVTLPAFYANLQASEDDPAYRSAADDVKTILAALQTNAVSGILVDLRNNGGGSLVEAIKMTGLFIETGPVVQVRERYGKRILYDRDPNAAYTGPLAVLVNSLSASASEIVAGALQDYGRAVIVGDSKTHGKGTVQTVRPLGRDRTQGAVKVTTASYFRISGSSTQLKGVSSDIVIPSPFDMMELGEDHLDNPIPWSSDTPAGYTPLADLSGSIAVARRLSQDRRDANPRFDAYRRYLDRIAMLQTNVLVSLVIDKRRELARTEKALSDLQEDLALQALPGEADGDDQPDLVLEETLRILADLVPLWPAAVTVDPPDAPVPAEDNRFLRWIRERL
ncbi:MAG: carboxy terminal-processing peptidase [Lentisphaerae bacterium]|nr:carboxy terminal-processing peptidase [Lentisphaerota bacterium]